MEKIVVLDGAMGTMLQQLDMDLGKYPECLNITNGGVIENIHRMYVEAGAEIIYANTFGANTVKLENAPYTVEDVISAAIKNARKAAGNKAKVAASFGSLGKLLEPSGELSFEEAYGIYKRSVTAAKDADLIVFETLTDLAEARVALLAAKENTDKPVFVTMSFEENGRTFSGASVECAATVLTGLSADAIGINCSLGPDKILPLIERMSRCTDLPLIAKANAGLPDKNGNFSVGPEEFAEYADKFRKIGVKYIGGCCGTTPSHIEKISGLPDRTYITREYKKVSDLSSSSVYLEINSPKIVGERINPTGKKRFKEALKNHDIDYILTCGISQSEAGAHILDVNLGLPEINEESMMAEVVPELQATLDIPLQIDSTNPAVIEAGLRKYVGKAIVNSVNGEEELLCKILPVVKKYGAAVIGLTLDEKGIPETVGERVAIAERIVNKALSYGIPKEDIYIDCLTMTVSALPDAARITLESLREVKKKLGVKTVLGVSNVSFGLPCRELINSAFLTMALENGLDLAIINPNNKEMAAAFNSYMVLSGIDAGGLKYIEKYADNGVKEAPIPKKSDVTLEEAIYNGMKTQAGEITRSLIDGGTPPLDVVNNILIPALDKVGEDFEKSVIFLPQLIRSADSAGGAFDVIKSKMTESGEKPVSKGKIIVATVKGDIHDIGKNIVKVVLENYGYTVIDLGKDVAPEKVLKAVQETGAKLVGLSALMTTTTPNMEATIKLLHDKTDAKVMVGGAVLNRDYAMEIGADYYSKDAKKSADIAKEFFMQY